MTNDAFIDIFGMGLDSAAIVMLEFQLRAVGDMGDRFDYDLCDQVTICLDSERIATDLCAKESTNGDLGDHGDQLETNQRSIFEDLSALHGAPWRSVRAPQIAT